MVQTPKSGRNQGQSGVFLWSANYTRADRRSTTRIPSSAFLGCDSHGKREPSFGQDGKTTPDGWWAWILSPLPCWGRARRCHIYSWDPNLSRTDVECQWKKPRQNGETTKAACELFPPTKAYSALSREPTSEDREWLFKELSRYGRFTAMRWLMSPEPTPEPHNLLAPIANHILQSKDFTEKSKDQQIKYFRDTMLLNKNTIKGVTELTCGQRVKDSWHMIRKGRLTASNFGHVLQSKTVSPSLIKRLISAYDLSRVKAVAWGVNNEAEAINKFSAVSGLEVKETGIWLEESGLLGASPDGLVGQDAVLEVKCPYTIRNQIIKEGLKNKSFCLAYDNLGFSLKKNHPYWHQVQGQMHLTGRKYCYFVVWTIKDTLILNISKDEEWGKNLDILRNFYLNYIFSELAKSNLQQNKL
ncbi:Exonuclease [Nymphon striatum]|nr:Exonuclease [Nymphon striatum]